MRMVIFFTGVKKHATVMLFPDDRVKCDKYVATGTKKIVFYKISGGHFFFYFEIVTGFNV